MFYFVAPIAVQLDESVLHSLTEMGFPIEGCKKAIFHTGNLGLEAAVSWIMEHMGDTGRKSGHKS